MSNIISALQQPLNKTPSNDLPHVDPSTAFSFKTISETDVKLAISSLKSPATSSHDKMSLRLFKLSMLAIAVPLCGLFNMSITTNIFPSACKLAQVTPIHKKENRHDIANYRPISLLPLLSKIMEHAINQ